MFSLKKELGIAKVTQVFSGTKRLAQKTYFTLP